MQNIEIKAKCEDLEQAENIAKKAGARFECLIHQRDTYFMIKKGRLKLREISPDVNQLIYYDRPNQAGPKTSEYYIYPVAAPEQLKKVLGTALGTWKTVEKERKIYLFDEVRIHLDAVKSLGNFLEFEGVVSPGSDKTKIRAKVDWLISQFGIRASDLIAASYSDLISDERKLA